MHFDLIALYGGPDQVMTVTSAFASIVGILLIFWNKIVAAFFKFVHLFRRESKSSNVAPPQNTSKTSS
jgi:undecaprenyl pyrophosphate phosphatase UppP